tara:strand:+ start:363 stop:545 length:183 start_codon:yes stop_codon:yes gene_type:complete
MKKRNALMKKETVETLIEDLSDELVDRLDSPESYGMNMRIEYLQRAINELKEIRYSELVD